MADHQHDDRLLAHRKRAGLHLTPPLTMRDLQTSTPWIVPVAAGMCLVLAVLATLDLLPWDRPITEWIADHRTTRLNDLWSSVTQLGGDRVVWPIAVGCAGLAWPRCRPLAIAILILALTRPPLVFALKEIVDRDRPPAALAITHPGGPSFPSGHPFAAAASWGFIPLVIALYTTRRWVWWVSVCLVWSLIFVIGASRVYLGAHYATDVIATLLLALVFVASSELFIGWLHRRGDTSRFACGAHQRNLHADQPPR